MIEQKQKKPLTERQAKNCEEAREPVCHCRCGGAMHGGKRGGGNASMEFYYGLPEDDPHYTPSPEKRKQQQQERIAAKKRAKQERVDAAWKVTQDILSQKYAAQRENNWELANQFSKQFKVAYDHYEAVRKSKDGILEEEEQNGRPRNL